MGLVCQFFNNKFYILMYYTKKCKVNNEKF